MIEENCYDNPMNSFLQYVYNNKELDGESYSFDFNVCEDFFSGSNVKNEQELNGSNVIEEMTANW